MNNIWLKKSQTTFNVNDAVIWNYNNVINPATITAPIDANGRYEILTSPTAPNPNVRIRVLANELALASNPNPNQPNYAVLLSRLNVGDNVVYKGTQTGGQPYNGTITAKDLNANSVTIDIGTTDLIIIGNDLRYITPGNNSRFRQDISGIARKVPNTERGGKLQIAFPNMPDKEGNPTRFIVNTNELDPAFNNANISNGVKLNQQGIDRLVAEFEGTATKNQGIGFKNVVDWLNNFAKSSNSADLWIK